MSSLANNKRSGASAEIAAREWLRDTHGWPVERVRLSGILDRGDLGGVPGLCISVKSTKAVNPPWRQWVREVKKQAATVGGVDWVIMFRPPRHTNPGDWILICHYDLIEDMRLAAHPFHRSSWLRSIEAAEAVTDALSLLNPPMVLEPDSMTAAVRAKHFFEHWAPYFPTIIGGW